MVRNVFPMAETRSRSTYAEIEIRREQVLRLRFARLSEPEIAERLRVSASTVSRDLQVIHESWGERFRAEFDPEPKLGHASLKRQVAVIGRVSEQPVVYECDVGSKVVVIEKIECLCERRNARTLAQIKFPIGFEFASAR